MVLLVDDAEVWRDLPCRDWLKAFVRKASGSRHGVILGGDVASVAMGFSGWQAEVKKNRRGALLSPSTSTRCVLPTSFRVRSRSNDCTIRKKRNTCLACSSARCKYVEGVDDFLQSSVLVHLSHIVTKENM